MFKDLTSKVSKSSTKSFLNFENSTFKLVTLVLFLLVGLVLNVDANSNNKTVGFGHVGPGVADISHGYMVTGNDDIISRSLNDPNVPSAGALTSDNSTSKPCNSSNLDTCWNKLPPLGEPGIPSSPAAVDIACRAFDTGMSCVEDWAKQCLGKAAREKVKTSVQGAHETFTFLCRDSKFRAEFLSHASCFKKISHLWDECAKRFIESLKRVDDNHEPLTICCIRLRFLQCETEVAHIHCTQSAEKFLTRMADTLLRSDVRNHAPVHCKSVTLQNCSETSGSGPCSKPSIHIPISTLNQLYAVASSLFPSPKLLSQKFSNFVSLYV